jgi:hypothetical protein
MDIFISLVVIAVGLTLLFMGFRVARLAIPLWGFVVGCSLGAAVAGDLANTPFLATTVGIVVGIFMGLLFALFAYLYYAVAVILLFGGLGYWMGSGLLLLLGFSPGVLSVSLGIVLGIMFSLAALFANAPRLVLILITSVAGAVSAIGGLLLLFNQIPREAFSYATASAAVTSSWWWSLLALVAAIIGIAVQSATTSDYTFEKWALGESDEEDHLTTPHAHTPHHA